ncbi:MAG: hypothetical protein VYE04_03170 [Pseudomonadota bacterium]|nr:hypothetical protein [Pseudomonadota bacterium]
MIGLGIVLLGAMAAAFVGAPLLRRRGQHRQLLDVDLAKQMLLKVRLEEIAQAGGSAEGKSELAAESTVDLFSSDKDPIRDTVSEPIAARVILAVAVVIPFLAWLIFSFSVDLDLPKLKGAEAVLVLDAEKNRDELLAWQDKLAAYGQTNTNNVKVHYLLGQSRLKTGDYAQAAASFALAHRSSPEDINIRVLWLQARFLAAGGSLDDAGHQLAEQILGAVPNVSVVLEILALDAISNGRASEAVVYLNRVLSGLDNPSRAAGLVAAIRGLRAQFQQPGIDVEVRAEGDIPQSATVFVIARPVGGGMPYAVVRRPAELMPMIVRLDDLVSMSDVRKLSEAEEFEIVVRLSRSGQAMEQAGDWEWLSVPMSLEADPEKIISMLQAPQSEDA